ncbi:hypothetical protein V2G26_018727 [Clonostachys chloroleuca]
MDGVHKAKFLCARHDRRTSYVKLSASIVSRREPSDLRCPLIRSRMMTLTPGHSLGRRNRNAGIDFFIMEADIEQAFAPASRAIPLRKKGNPAGSDQTTFHHGQAKSLVGQLTT